MTERRCVEIHDVCSFQRVIIKIRNCAYFSEDIYRYQQAQTCLALQLVQQHLGIMSVCLGKKNEITLPQVLEHYLFQA